MNFTKYFLTVLVAATLVVTADNASAQDEYIGGGSELEFNLFQNFYTQPGASTNQAALYNAPYPVPYWVGQTYYTYQPFYPHQFLYTHKKNYYNYNGTSDQFYSDNCNHGQGGNALNKTTVRWTSGWNHLGHLPFSSYMVQRAKYGIHSKKYCLNCDPNRGHGGHCVGGHCGRRHCVGGHCR